MISCLDNNCTFTLRALFPESIFEISLATEGFSATLNTFIVVFVKLYLANQFFFIVSG
jgi:hypothetical protein